MTSDTWTWPGARWSWHRCEIQVRHNVGSRQTCTPDCSASFSKRHKIPHLSASALSLSNVIPCRDSRKLKCSLLTLFISLMEMLVRQSLICKMRQRSMIERAIGCRSKHNGLDAEVASV